MKKLGVVALVLVTGLTTLTSCGGETMTPQEAAFERRVQSAMRGGCSREDAIRVARYQSEQADATINGFTNGIKGKHVILK